MSNLLNIFGEPQVSTLLYYLADQKIPQSDLYQNRKSTPVLVEVKDPDVFWHLFSVYWWLVCLSYELTPQGWFYHHPTRGTIPPKSSDLELLLLDVLESEDPGVQHLLLHANLARYCPNENVVFCPLTHPFETEVPITTARPNVASNVLEWYPVTTEGAVDYSRPMIRIAYFGEWHVPKRKEGLLI